MLKTIDLFAGAGGLSWGFQQTGYFNIVAAAENNPKARLTYRRNHSGTKLYTDVRQIDYSNIVTEFGDIDVVIGGPPCQGFSNANRQHTTIISMNNRLVKEYVRAICELKPKAFVMENVAMLRSNIHRFLVDEADINDSTVMGLPLSEDKIELLPEGVDFPNKAEFAKDYSNIKKYLWDEKTFKILYVLYRYRINRAKLASTIEKRKKDLEKIIVAFQKEDGNDTIHHYDIVLAQALSDYINCDNPSVDAIISQLTVPIHIQQLLGKMGELYENKIKVFSYNSEGALIATVKSYAVLDYVKGVLGNAPYDYDIGSQLLNAAQFGAPQKRERFIVVGIRKDLGIQYEFPKPILTEEHYYTVRDAISDIESIPVSTDVVDGSQPIQLPQLDDNVLSPLAKQLRGKLLYNHISTATTDTAKARFESLKEGQNFHDLDTNLKTNTYSNADRTQNTIYMRLKYDEPSGTVVNVRKSMWEHPTLDRAISIREAARLQTFPDSFIFEGSKDSQYQQVGNAVPPVLAKAIAKSLATIM